MREFCSRALLVVTVVLFVVGSTIAFAESCPTDFTLTNEAQLATYIDQPGLSYPLAFPYEPGQWLPLDIWFADFSQLTNALAAVTNHTAQTQYGVAAWPVRITQYAETGLLVVRYQPTESELLQVEPPSSLAASEHYVATLPMWCILNGMNPTNYAALLAEGYTVLDPPRTIVDLWLADARTEPVWTNATPPTVASGNWRRSGDFEPDDDGSPCLITNEAAPFSMLSISQDTNQWTTITWQSCTNYVYGILSSTDLSNWTGVTAIWGGDFATNWIDTSTAGGGTLKKFYKVVRIPPDQGYNGNPIASGWALDNGLNPMDPNLEREDHTGDGYTILEDYFDGTSPNVSNAPPVFIINHGNLYSASLNIPVQPTSTNYPNFLVWLDTLSTNTTLFTNSGAAVTYTLPDEGDGVYGVYAQYADSQGNPASPAFAQSVTLDRQPPVVAITAPASNAVLDQAFMTLAATVYDPGAMQPDTTGPLSVWINGQPFWDRAGTNLVVQRFPVPAGTNSFAVTILAVDAAGNTNSASRTWTVNTSGDTTAPQCQ